MTNFNDWPTLKSYENEYLRRVALPVGGIGTGTISLGGRGDLRDWEVLNRPAKGFTPLQAFFALRTEVDGEVFARALEGPVSPHDYEGAFGCAVPNHGLPRFREVRFEAAYPLGQVVLADGASPLDVRLQAFNPLVPADADASGFPVFVLRVVLHNPSTQAVRASVVGSHENFIGRDAAGGETSQNHYEWRQSNDLCGIFGTSRGVSPTARQWGTLAMAAIDAPGQNVSYRTAWKDASWGNTLLDFWDDFTADGRLDNPVAAAATTGAVASEPTATPIGSVCASVTLAPGETRPVTFLLGWHFPNRETWSPDQAPDGKWGGEGGVKYCGPPRIGNYYTTQFRE